MDKKVCGCAGACHCHGGVFHLMKVILKIFIMILIFWAGFKLGQESGFIRASYGREMMRGNYGYQMMGSSGWNNTDYNNIIPPVPTQTTPITPATPAK